MMMDRNAEPATMVIPTWLRWFSAQSAVPESHAWVDATERQPWCHVANVLGPRHRARERKDRSANCSSASVRRMHGQYARDGATSEFTRHSSQKSRALALGKPALGLPGSDDAGSRTCSATRQR